MEDKGMGGLFALALENALVGIFMLINMLIFGHSPGIPFINRHILQRQGTPSPGFLSPTSRKRASLCALFSRQI